MVPKRYAKIQLRETNVYYNFCVNLYNYILIASLLLFGHGKYSLWHYKLGVARGVVITWKKINTSRATFYSTKRDFSYLILHKIQILSGNNKEALII